MHLSRPIADSVNVAFYVKESVEIHSHGIPLGLGFGEPRDSPASARIWQIVVHRWTVSWKLSTGLRPVRRREAPSGTVKGTR
jgi:hypothetical protein